MTETSSRTVRAHTWGIDARRSTVIPAALLAIAIASVPLHGVQARVLLAVGASAALLLAVITWSGLTAGQWICRRIAVAWSTRRHT